jgi:hypothetical protein
MNIFQILEYIRCNVVASEGKNQKQHCNCVGIESETELSIDISSRFLQATIQRSYKMGCKTLFKMNLFEEMSTNHGKAATNVVLEFFLSFSFRLNIVYFHFKR